MTLLDPFAGCGTAPLVGMQMGFRGIGFEPHPVFYRIGRAKLTAQLSDLNEIVRVLQKGFRTPVSSDTLPPAPRAFLEKLFTTSTLASLLGAREALTRSSKTSSDLAFLILSRTVDKCSHSQTDGIYKAPTTAKAAADPSAACDAIASLISDDLSHLPLADSGSSEYFEASSEDMSRIASGSVSLVVTSPPYLNNFDYAEMTRMLLYFWGIADSWRDISVRVRHRLVVNTTTALQPYGQSIDHRTGVPTSLRSELDALVSELRERRRVKAGKKPYDLLVYPYFSQMTSVLRECRRCLRQGGPIHIMVADAALYGVHVRSPQIIAAVLSDLGFHGTKCELVRKRGHRWQLAKREGSATGLGEYYVSATR